MGYCATSQQLNSFFNELKSKYKIYAPKCFEGGGRFSDTDCIRYGEVNSVEEIVFDKKSQFSFKEVVMPVSQTLFYFTEDECREPNVGEKSVIVFLRSCDIHAIKRLDQMYLKNGEPDYYYSKLREKVKFVLMGCQNSFENCFCVSMESNRTEDYNLSIDKTEDGKYKLNCKEDEWQKILEDIKCEKIAVEPCCVHENLIEVSVPEKFPDDIRTNPVWDEYDSRCINCGRCNFVCPTCSCYTMQDIFYTENGKVGERRRVVASCMVDGYTDVAGGGSYRKKNGQRMRFKVLHKIKDFKSRNGYNMCVGCGRCDDICPEYISYSNCINKLNNL